MKHLPPTSNITYLSLLIGVLLIPYLISSALRYDGSEIPVNEDEPMVEIPFLSKHHPVFNTQNTTEPDKNDIENTTYSSPPATLLSLCSWWNPQRGDNFATTDPRWRVKSGDVQWRGAHIVNGKQQSGYTMYRLEGLLFDPKEPRQPNTVPLYSWWNPQRQDNFATTDPRWSMDPKSVRWNGEHLANGRSQSGYKMYRLEGYLYDPKKPQPRGTIPIYSWWNPERGDNFLTSDPAWGMNPKSVQWNGEHLANGRSQSGYKMFRLEGYIFSPR